MTTNTLLMNRMQRFCIVLCFGCSVFRVFAEEVDSGQHLRINGFGTVGLLHNSNNFEGSFRREISQTLDTSPNRANVDSRLGVQANYTLNMQLELVGQLVLKDRISSNRPKDAIEWAFLAYRPATDLTVRLGRTSPDLFLLSDYRNVGFAYAPIRPAVDFYSMLPIAVLDGADIAKTWTSGDVSWRAKAFAGKSSYKFSGGMTGNQQGNLDSLMGVNLVREQNGLLLRATLSRSKLSFNSVDVLPLQAGLDALSAVPVPSVAAQAAELRSAATFLDRGVTYASLGAAYDRDSWLLSGEMLHTQSNFASAVIRAGYVTLGRRIGNVTVHSTVSSVRTSSKIYENPQWANALAPLAPLLGASGLLQAQALGNSATALFNTARVDQRTISLGMRWDFDPRMALKVQWDHTQVAPNGGVVWSGSVGGGRANVAAVALDFVF